MEVISQEEKEAVNIDNPLENYNNTPDRTKLLTTDNSGVGGVFKNVEINNEQRDLKENELNEEITQGTQKTIVDKTLKDMEETNHMVLVDEINDIDKNKLTENIKNEDDETVNSKIKHEVNEDNPIPPENGQDFTVMMDKYFDNNIKKSSRLREPKVKKNEKLEVETEDINNKSTVECEVCLKTFNSKTGLNNHIRIHLRPEKEKMYRCSLCKEEFNKNMDLVDHKKTHNNEDRTFLCKICKSAFSNHCEYVLHRLNHTKKTKFNCEECDYSSNSKSLFKCHVTIHYDKNLKCDVCSKIFKAHNSLHAHMQRHKTKLECGECGLIYNDKKVMNCHMLTHTGVRPYQCLYCGKGFFNPSARKNHTLTHTKAVNFKFHCDKCDKKFLTQQFLNSHKLTHEGKKYECKICLKKLRHKGSLRYHMLIHQKYNKDNKLLYSCMYCDLQFPTFQILKTHTLYKHTDIRPHRCELCNMDFKTTSDLCRHKNSKHHKNIAYALKSEDPK